MVYACVATECVSDTRKKPSKWPFMKDVTWVKFPKEQHRINRWISLTRRADKFPINKNTRICSRHFDKEEISENGFCSSDPKYFAWNNWGRPTKPRTPARRSLNFRNVQTVNCDNSDSDDDICVIDN